MQEITPTRDRVEDTVDTVDAPSETPVDKQVMVTTSVELEDFGRLTYEPLIDEPVTGSGNDDLWVPDCDPNKEGSCAQAAEPSGKPS